MQRFNTKHDITIPFLRMKQTSIRIQQEFHQEISQKVTLLSLYFILPPRQVLVPGRPDFFPLDPLPGRHGTTISIHVVTIMAIWLFAELSQSQFKARSGVDSDAAQWLAPGQPTVQRPTQPPAAAQASSWASSSQSLACCSPAGHLSSQTLLYRPASLGNQISKWRAGRGLTISSWQGWLARGAVSPQVWINNNM